MEWISVKDRLPEDGEDVLFYYDYISIGWYEDEWFYDSEDKFSAELDITHWMPLPESPNER